MEIKDQREHFMRNAIKLSEQNIGLKNGGPFGAVVVKDGRIIGKGINTVTIDNDPTAHAEINALRDACSNLGTYHLEDCEIYSSCEPCPMCLGAVYWSRVKALYYAADRHDAANAGFDDAFFYDQVILPAGERELETAQLLRTEAQQVFKEWSDHEHKLHY